MSDPLPPEKTPEERDDQPSEPDVAQANGTATQFREFLRRARDRIARVVPPGVRWLVGLLLIFGGILGFLPVLGFWMIPLGVAVAALDIKPILRWWKSKR